MTVQQFLYSVLTENDDVSSLVGNRIYPLFVPASTTEYPCVVYTVKKTKGEGSKDGNEWEVLITFTCIAKRYDRAHIISENIWEALDDDEIRDYGEEEGFLNYELVSVNDSYIPQIDVEATVVELTIKLTEIWEGSHQYNWQFDNSDNIQLNNGDNLVFDNDDESL